MNRNTENEEMKISSNKGASLLESLRKNEKEKQTSFKSTPYLGDIANWKNTVKPKTASKGESEMNIENPVKEIKEGSSMSFKDALDNFTKINNDSEISFKQTNVNVPELWSMINMFQSDITNSNVNNNDAVEFKWLLEKLNNLWNKNKTPVNVSHWSDDKIDSK